jgi:hypothetical protein
MFWEVYMKTWIASDVKVICLRLYMDYQGWAKYDSRKKFSFFLSFFIVSSFLCARYFSCRTHTVHAIPFLCRVPIRIFWPSFMTSQSRMFIFVFVFTRVLLWLKRIFWAILLMQPDSSGRTGHSFRQAGPILNTYITFPAAVKETSSILARCL